MDEFLPIVVFVVVIALGIGIFLWDRYATQKRIEALQALAASLGYEYVPQANMLDRLGGFGLVDRGHGHQTNNLLRSRADDTTTAVFDWHYVTGSGKHRTVHNQTVLFFESPRLDLPALSMHPEGFGGKILKLLGQQDINFENHSGFSKAYMLQGADEARIRALFDGVRLNFFAQHPGLYIHAHGRQLLYYRAEKRVAPDAIPAFIQDGQQVVALLANETPPAAEADPLAGLDEVLAELGVTEGEA